MRGFCHCGARLRALHVGDEAGAQETPVGGTLHGRLQTGRSPGALGRRHPGPSSPGAFGLDPLARVPPPAQAARRLQVLPLPGRPGLRAASSGKAGADRLAPGRYPCVPVTAEGCTTQKLHASRRMARPREGARTPPHL